MRLIATSRREGAPVACAYGAALENEGRALHVGLLYVMRGQARRVVTFREPKTKNRVRVRLPRDVLGKKGHAAILNITLEVLP